MKKLLFGAFMLTVMAACNNDSITNQNENKTDEAATLAGLAQRGCASEEIRQEALKKSPELQQRFAALESNTEKFANDVKFGKVLADGTVEIPVVVNVIYKTTAENVSEYSVSVVVSGGGIHSQAEAVRHEIGRAHV